MFQKGLIQKITKTALDWSLIIGAVFVIFWINYLAFKKQTKVHKTCWINTGGISYYKIFSIFLYQRMYTNDRIGAKLIKKCTSYATLSEGITVLKTEFFHFSVLFIRTIRIHSTSSRYFMTLLLGYHNRIVDILLLSAR